MSQDNQHSINTLFRGRTDRSALLDAQDEQTTLTYAPFNAILAYRPAASVPHHTSAENKSKSLASENKLEHLQQQPLFQDFTRRIPTQAEIKTAEEIEYDRLVRKFGQSIKPRKTRTEAKVRPAPYSHTSSIIDGLIGPHLESLHLHDRDMSG
ncbi:MAG: hypothetical protein Q9221_002073 [Calogaya cf. arnoldii]